MKCILAIILAAALLVVLPVNAGTLPPPAPPPTQAPASSGTMVAVPSSMAMMLGQAAAVGGGSNDLCRTSNSFGVANLGMAVTLGLSTLDANCVRIKNARMLLELGYLAAAVQLFCQDPKVKSAMAAAGTPCQAQKAAN